MSDIAQSVKKISDYSKGLRIVNNFKQLFQTMNIRVKAILKTQDIHEISCINEIKITELTGIYKMDKMNRH